MPEQLKELIEKIRQEGVQAAESRAREIEAEAKSKARAIIQEAKEEAQRLIEEAQGKNAKLAESTEASLGQAGRDLLLILRGEIDAMLDRLIKMRLQEALTLEELARIITTIIKDGSRKDKEDIIISLNKKDLDSLEKGFLSQLKDTVRAGIVMRPSEDILGGFIISYDGGKSHFDFSDEALAGYISSYLKPKLAQVLQSK